MAQKVTIIRAPETRQECARCGGDRQCGDCVSGKLDGVKCSTCNGSGNCPDCGGSGWA